MTSENPVLSSFDPDTGIARIIFNRPSVFNALDVATAAAFERCVTDLARQGGVRVVVMTGAGPAFMAGGDIAAMASDLDQADRVLRQLLTHMHPALLTLRQMDAPIVAAVNGVAAGAGLSLVLGADYVVATRSARLVLAYDKLGVPPDCAGTWFLSRKVGRARAFEMMLLGAAMSAEDAARAGIVNLVAEDEDFAASVERVLRQIASGPTRAFGLFKALMDSDASLETQMERERQSFVTAIATQDFRTSSSAFLNKTKPSFSGR